MSLQSIALNLAGIVMTVLGFIMLYEGIVNRKPFVIYDNLTKEHVNSMTFEGVKGICYSCLISLGYFLAAYMIYTLL